jgi:hypothetical protein
MAKKAAAFLLCMAALFFCGCEGKPTASTSVETGAATNAPRCYDFHYGTLLSIGSGNNILETEDAVYYLFQDHIYYSDKTYKEFLPLCGKPDCNHKNADCDALICTKSGIWIYDGYLFYVDAVPEDDEHEVYVTEPALWRMRLDGSQHEKVMQLPIQDFGFTPLRNSWSYVFTNKYLYVACSAYQTDSVGPEASNGAARCSYVIQLDSFEVSIIPSDNAPAPQSFVGLPLAGRGSLLYSVRSHEDDPETGLLDLAVFDLDTLEGRSIGTLAKNFYYLEGGFLLQDHAFEYICFDAQNMRMSLYRMDLETGENELLREGGPSEVKWNTMDWANRYLFAHRRSNLLDRSEWGFYVFDSDLNEVDVLSYADAPEEIAKIRVFLQTDSYIFAAPEASMDPEHPEVVGIYAAFTIPTWYIDKAEIGTGTLAWHRWAPEVD